MPKIEEIKAKAVPILKAAGASRAALFGSYAKGNATSKSDIDILVELPDHLSLLDFVGIQLDLEDMLDTKVDLVEYDAIKPDLKQYILKDLVSLI
ncbi:MAG TPA: nucleotidyltransferase family protein [Candidatus Paceibacterota bacterium]